jgi:mevalonate kinase
MELNRHKFDGLIAQLDDIIADVAAADLKETALLLRMAQIDLVTRTNNITQEELDALLFVARSGKELSKISGRGRGGARTAMAG